MDYHNAAGRNRQPQAVCSSSSKDLIELCELYLKNCQDKAIEEAFIKECLKSIRHKVDYYVMYQDICPSFLAPSTFAEDVLNVAEARLGAKIRFLRSSRGLKTWLGKLVNSSVYDELRQFTRRTKKRCEWQTLSAPADDAEAARSQRTLDELLRWDPDLTQLEYKEIVERVLNETKPHPADPNWQILKLSVDHSIEEIAELLGQTKVRVRYVLKKSKQRFGWVAEKRYRFRL